MFSNRFAFAALAAACVAAAAGGGYLASRQNATPAPLAAATPAAVPAPAPSAPAEARPVQETEAVIGDKPVKATGVAPEAERVPPSPARSAERVPPPAARRSPVASRPSNGATSATPARRPAAPPPLERTWPSSAAANTQPAQAPPANPPAADATAQQPPARPIDPDPPRAPEPPVKTYEELVVSADSVIGLQMESTISSERARVEDRVDARVVRDVRVGDRVAIPAGTRAIGSVTQVERGGKFKERAHLAIRFHTLVLADGTRVPISTETITRDGDAPTSAQKIGGAAVGGAIIGAILGGTKGAVIGGATGAGAGAAATAAGDRSAATLAAGTQSTVRILAPVTVTVERNDQ